MPAGCGADPFDRREVGGRLEVAGHAEVVAEVLRPDEQDVDPIEGRDLLDLLDGGRRLDLHHAQDLTAGAAQRVRVEPEATGPVVGRHAPVPVGRVPQVPDRLADLFGRVHTGQHHPGGAQVQDSADPDAGPGLHPHHRRDAIGTRSRDHVADLLLPA